MRIRSLSLVALILVAAANAGVASRAQTVPSRQARPAAAATVDVPVSEGTSMSVAVSPDGRTLAVDLQGSLWTIPAAGGTATRITDVFNDARQPAWSPDGRTIAFFAYRDGGYDLWAMAPDGTRQRKLTCGAFDDREPVWSHDGTRIAFSSDRGDPLGSDYNIWVLDLTSGALRQLTTDAADDSMPTWSPNDAEIAFVSTRDGERHVWAVPAAGGAERRIARRKVASTRRRGDRVDRSSCTRCRARRAASSWAAPRSPAPRTCSRSARAGRRATEFFYIADGKIRRRSVGGADASPTSPFTATLQVTRPATPASQRDFDSRAPRKVLGMVRPVISPDGVEGRVRGHRRHLGDADRRQAAENLTKDRFLDTDPAWSPDGTKLVYSSDKGGDAAPAVDPRPGDRSGPPAHAASPRSRMGASWSPDGTRIAFLDVDGMWRRARGVGGRRGERRGHDASTTRSSDPGTPTWSPDGRRVAVGMVCALLRPASAKARTRS